MSGASTAASKPLTLTARDPQTGRVTGEIAATDPREIGEIVARARKVQPEWAGLRRRVALVT
ncbi:MAG: hypothetical protein M3343_05420 [Actinomycetota bacterium]|nr:hypothetical protein [Actinomycetota bacterium]